MGPELDADAVGSVFDLRRLGQESADGEVLDILASVTLTCLTETYSAIVPLATLQDETIEKRKLAWLKLLGNAENYCVSVCKGEEIVGFLSSGIGRSGAGSSHIYSLYVLNAHKRRGIGKRLLGSALDHFADRGLFCTTVGVLAMNSAAVAFYEQQGGQRTEETTYHWGGVDYLQFIYGFDLSGRLSDRLQIRDKPFA